MNRGIFSPQLQLIPSILPGISKQKVTEVVIVITTLHKKSLTPASPILISSHRTQGLLPSAKSVV